MGNFNKIYENIYKTMGELQPIAFLLSASIVISGIFSINGDLLNRVYTLSAAGCFFFAYLYFLIFKLTKFNFFLVPGIASLTSAFYFIFRAAIGIIVVATNLNEKLYSNGHSSDLELIMTIMVITFIVTFSAYAIYRIYSIKHSKIGGHKYINKVIICLYSLYFIVFILIMIRNLPLDFVDIFAYEAIGSLGVDVFLLSLVFIYEILEETGWITNYEKGSSNRAPVVNNQKTANWSSKADTPVPLTILAHKLWKVGNGGYAVTGTAQSSTDLSYAEVKVKFYQESGALIDSGSTLINDLAAGEKWNFKVFCINTHEHVANYKITVGSRF